MVNICYLFMLLKNRTMYLFSISYSDEKIKYNYYINRNRHALNKMYLKKITNT